MQLILVWTSAYFHCPVHLTPGLSVIQLNICMLTSLTALTTTPPYVFLKIPVWSPLSQWSCSGDEGADGGQPNLSTCQSKINPSSFLYPLILSFKATNGQAAGRAAIRAPL